MFSRLVERLAVETSGVAESRRGRLATGGLLAGTGVVASVGHVLTAVRESWSLLGTVLGPGIGAAFAVVVVGSAVWLTQTDLGESLPSITVWCLGSLVVFAAVGQLFRLSQHAAGVSVPSGGFLLGYLATSGAVVGLFIGVYDATLRRARRQAEAQRQRAERLSDRVSVLNQTMQTDVQQSVREIRQDAGRLTQSTSGSRELVERSHDQASGDCESPDSSRDPAVGVEPEPTPRPQPSPTEQPVRQSVSEEPSERERPTGTAMDPAERIRRRAERLQQTTQTAGELGREWDRERTASKPTDLTRLVVETVAEVTEAYPAAEIGTEMPEQALANVNPGVGLVFRELVENAVEHGGTPQPTVQLSCELTAEIVKLRVTDDGSGIPDDVLEPIVADDTSSEATDSMGLWVAEWVTDTNDGTLAFDTGDDGTTVTVRFPRADESRDDSDTTDESPFSPNSNSGLESDPNTERGSDTERDFDPERNPDSESPSPER